MTKDVNDLGRVASDQALVNEAATHLHPSGVDPSREFIDQIVDAVRHCAKGGRPKSFGFGSPHSTAVHLGFIEECSQKKPCKTCGTPRHDWTYWKVTLAGQAYLALAIAMETGTAETSGSVGEADDSAAIAQGISHDR